MSVEYADLDKLRPDDRVIKVNKTPYKIPGRIPVKYVLDIMKYSKSMNSENTDERIQGMENYVDAVYNIFKIRNPNLKSEDFSKMIDFNEAVAIANYLCGNINPEETIKSICSVE